MTGEDQPAATATVAVQVKVTPDVAFEVFTREIDRWWKRGPKYRRAGNEGGRMAIEPRLGGRVFETWLEGGAERCFDIGRVRVWEPPERLVFGWRNETFEPLEDTEVEVVFEAVRSGTLVTVRHRGFESLREDHPVRHGREAAAFARMIGLWWGELLGEMRVICGDS